MRKTEQTPAADALSAIISRLAEIRSSREADVAELRRLDQPGRFLPQSNEEQSKLKIAARQLLNGAAEKFLPSPPPGVSLQIRELKRKIEVADAAIAEGGDLVEKLKNDAAVERYRLRADEVRASMVAIVDAVVALEMAFQRRDALLKEIKPPASLIPGAGWALLGRLGRSESMSYRFLQSAAAAGWITEQQFTAAVEQSRKALRS